MSSSPPPLPRPFAFPWGRGQIVEEVRTRGEHHVPAIQLLEYEGGGLSIRFCYYDHRGRFQRGPLLVRAEELDSLRAELARAPRLRELLQRLIE